MVRGAEVAVADLPAADRARLEDLIQASGLDAPSTSGPSARARGARDMEEIEIDIERGGAVTRHAFAELDLPERVGPLVEWLRRERVPSVRPDIVHTGPSTPGMQFLFQPFELDPGRRRLTASGEPVAISDRHLDVLLLLVARAGQIVSKDELIEAGWKDVAVGDNSLEQAISTLRRLIGPGHIDTVARRGYRFSAPVTRGASRETDAGLEALLAPHRAFLEGRAALETLDVEQVARARRVFEDAVGVASEQAAAHIGLANACAMQFEITRADSAPDAGVLAVAVTHARRHAASIRARGKRGPHSDSSSVGLVQASTRWLRPNVR